MTSIPPRQIFVYGTLKRGLSNHRYLAGQQFIGEAATTAGFRLFDLGGYPGMISDPATGRSIRGEVWAVDADCLRQLDLLEDVAGGEYLRTRIPLLPPFSEKNVEGYLYLRPVGGLRELDGVWNESNRG